MKALIEAYKPIVLDHIKNFLYGVGAFLATVFAVAIIGLIFKLENGTIFSIAKFFQYAFLAIAVSTIGKVFRKKLGK